MRLPFLLLSLLSATAVSAQTPIRVQVRAASDSSPIAGALVRAGQTSVRTGPEGLVTLDRGAERVIHIARIGFSPDSIIIEGPMPDPTVIYLQRVAEIEGVIVSATRSERRIEDDPLRVEVLNREEVEEKIRMTPGDITMMMNETPGLRVQTTNPSLGGANVRVQGMRGRYTQILSDGLPLFGSQTGGLGLLQIPPMDLGGVEVIKGVASALYGGNALGGVINLRSRVPGDDPIGEILVNQSMLQGSDAIGFGARRFGEHWSSSLLAGYHAQEQRDFDKDLWTDLAKYRRYVVRPRLFWASEAGHSMMFTGGFTNEDRVGGSYHGAPAPDGGPTYMESLDTRRYDAGGVGRWIFGNTMLSMRASSSRQEHEHNFGGVIEPDRHASTFGELAATRTIGTTSLTGGVALQLDDYRNDYVPEFDFRFTAPGAFAQATFDPLSRLSVTASARYDDHSRYGGQFSPRLSALVRAPADVTMRLSAGEGFFAPTPLTEETEVIGLRWLAPSADLVAERAQTMSVDVGRPFGPAEANVTFFASKVKHAIGLVVPPPSTGFAATRFRNASEPTNTSGVDAVVRLTPEPWHVTMSYTFTDARETPPSRLEERLVPLTPRHQAGLVAAWESELTRAGFEVYYTGRQSLDENPYRTESKPYTHLGVLVERRFGRARVWINAENLLDVRQTKYDPLVRPSRGFGGRWTTDVWAPLDGRTANLGVRFDLWRAETDEH
jgi:iron complex outermembrane receptor protein